MAVAQKYQGDVEAILARRYDNGWDYWTTPDKRLLKDSPFSALGSAKMLLELGMETSEPILKEVAKLIFGAWREDGRFKLYPQGAICPCQTVHAARCFAIWDTPTAGSAKLLSISSIYSTATAAGAATNSFSGEARKRSFPIPAPR